jgi:hypothetical protein
MLLHLATVFISNIALVTDRRMEVKCDTEHPEHSAECDSVRRSSHRVLAMCPYGCNKAGPHNW